MLGRPYVNHYAIVHNNLGEAIAILYVGVSLDAVNAAVARAFFSILVSAGGAIVAVLVLLWFTVRPLSRNASALARDAEALAEGRVDDVATRPGRDELGRVAGAFARIVVVSARARANTQRQLRTAIFRAASCRPAVGIAWASRSRA